MQISSHKVNFILLLYSDITIKSILMANFTKYIIIISNIDLTVFIEV